MNESLLAMWIYAVQSKRITLDFVPKQYQEEVKKVLDSAKSEDNEK